MANHSMSPWHAEGNNIRANHGGLVATVEAGYQQMRDRDARLIAAAPEMLAALQMVAILASSDTAATKARMAKAGSIARAAIEKATGGNHG